MKKLTTLAALAAILPALAAAQEYRYMPEPDFNMVLNSAMIPLQPKDAFIGVAACGGIDAKTLRAWTLPEAVNVLKPCLAGVSKRYAMGLQVDRGVVGAVANGRGAVLGIVITADSTLLVGNSMIRDLNYALSLRGGQLMGFKAVVRRTTDPAPAVPSAAQAAIDRCMLPTVVRKIETGDDFINYFGGCLRRAPELKVADLKSWTGHQLGVMVLTDSEGAAAESINGVVTVNGETGPVKVDVVAYPKTVFLP